MADLSMEEFRARLSSARTNAQAQGSTRNVVQVAPVPVAPRTFEQRYGRPGVPLDTTTGVGIGQRALLSFAPDDASRVESLKLAFRGATVDPVEGGDFIIRSVQDPASGQVKDLLVDENQVTFKDFADLASAVPELVVGLAAMRRAGGAMGESRVGSFLRTLVQSGAGAAGSQTMGALSDAAFRLGVGQDVQPGEIATRRALNAGIEVGMGVTGDLAARGFRSVGRAATSPTTEATMGVTAAVDRIAEATGQRIPLTLAEETGRPLALRAEAVAEKTPFGGIALRRVKREAETSLRNVQRALVGSEPLPPAETIGQRAIDTLRQYTRAAETGVDDQIERMAARAADDLSSAIERETGVARDVLKAEAGNAVRGGVIAHEQAFRTHADELFRAVGDDPALATAPLRSRLDDIKGELVKATNITTEASPLLDAFGRPVVSTTEGREVVREFVPEGLQRFIQGVEKLDDSMPLSELRALRTRVNDAINESEILPGVSSRLLRNFSNAVTEAIETGVAALPDQGVRQRLNAANTFYRENLPRFQVKGVTELLADPQQLKMGDRAVVTQAIRDPDQYFRVRDALTTPITSPDGTVVSPARTEAWNLFRKAALTDIESRARLAGSGTLMSGKKFLDELNRLDPEVTRDLLGRNSAQVIDSLRTLGGLEGKVDVDEFMTLLRSSNPNALEFQRLATRQADLDRLYQNDIIKKFVKGDIGTDAINAGDFVDRYLDTARSTTELGQVMAMLSDNPPVVEDIRRKTIQKFFKDAERKPTGSDIARGLNDDPTVMADPVKLFKSFQGDRDKLRVVLGDDTTNLLADYLRVEAARSDKDAAAQAVGGLVGGNLLSSLLQLQLKDAAAHAKYFTISQVLTSPVIRNVLRNSASLNPSDVAQAVVASAPFVEAVAEDYGEDAGRVLLQDMSELVGAATSAGAGGSTQRLTTPSAQPRNLSPEDFRSRLSGTTP